MNRTPVADWQQLSALYELADALDADSLADWLGQLRLQAHPLLPQLEQMLAARSQIQRNNFLGALPRLPEAPAPRAIDWQGGSRIGPYRLLRKIGSGGMAEVWLAQRDDGAFQRQVAIKLLFRHRGSDAADSFAQRFDRERDILASLNHPHIAGLHDAGVTTSGQPWLALEYVEGQTLTTWCDARQLVLEARVRLFRQVLLAVQHAHANLVIHRDLKPGNILVTAQGEVRLLDFGIAKLLEAEGGALAETELTRVAGRPMTPQYAAPEQLTGQPLTTACDVYSLGVVLYELLCGERPYELKMESTAQLEQAILEKEPRAPSRRALAEPAAIARGTTGALLRKELASDLDAIVLRALAKQPAQRYGSVEALRADLDRWLAGEPVEARAPSTAYRVGKFARRHMLSVALGVGAIVALAAVATVAVVMGLQAREDSARAVAARDFMLNIFQRANQEKSRGADITARDLLETGRKDVMTRLVGQPRLQAELLTGIAKIQGDMGDYTSADGTLAELVRLQAALGDPRAETWARANHADNAYQLGNPKLAAELLRGAKAVNGRPLHDAELNARLSELEGWLALAAGDAAQARAMLREARQRAVETLGDAHLRSFKLGQALLRAEAKLHNVDAALALRAELSQIGPRVKGVDAAELATMDWEQVSLLQDAGDFAQALGLVERTLPACSASLGADDQICRSALLQRGQLLLRLGLVEEAGRDLSRLAALAADPQWPYIRGQALVLQFRIANRLAPAPELAALAAQVRAFGESGDEVAINPVFKANALLSLAEASLLRGDPAAAHAWASRAATRLPAGPPGSASGRLAAIAGELGGVALLHQGHAAQALTALEAAQRDVERGVDPDHPIARLMALNLALALADSGRLSEARILVARAEPILRKALGATSPAYRRVRSLADRLDDASANADTGSATQPRDVPRPSSTREFFS